MLARLLLWLCFVGVLFSAAGATRAASALSYNDPAWSHDGKRIAAIGMDGGGSLSGRLVVMRADGKGVHRVPVRLGITIPIQPAWSPDDRSLAFAHAGGGILTVRLDGSDLRRLTGTGFAFGPAWSPGGRKIAYSAAKGEISPSSIYVINPNGTGSEIVASSPEDGSFFNPDWSPDGERLVFASGQSPDGGGGRFGLGTISDYRGAVKYLLRAGAIFPAWSPTGNEIAFVDDSVPGSYVFEGLISVFNLKTHRVRRLTIGASPTWSPDGRRIAFSRRGVIYVMNRTGKAVKRLTP